MGEISAKNMRKHAVIYALGNIVSKSVGFALIFVLYGKKEYFTVDDYSVLTIVDVSVALLAQLLGFSIAAGMVRFYFETNDELERKKLVSTTQIYLSSFIGLVALLLGLIAPWIAEPVFGAYGKPVTYLRLTLVILFLSAAAEPAINLMRAEQRSIFFVALVITKLVLEISAKVYLIASLGMGVEGELYGSVLAWVYAAFVPVLWLFAKVGFHFDFAWLKKLWRYSLPLIFSGLSGFALHSADRYMVGYFRGNEVGVYGMAYKFGYLVNFVILDPFLLIWYPFIFSISSREKQRETVAKAGTYFNAIMVYGALGLSVLIPYGYHFVENEDFGPGTSAVPVICLGYVFWALYQLFHTGFFVEKKTKELPYIVSAATVVNLALNMVLIPRMGMMGAAWATVIAFVVLAGLAYVRCEKVFSVRYEWGRLLAPIGLALGLYLGTDWVHLGHLGFDLLLDLAALALYPLLLWGGGFVRPEERALALEALRRRLRKNPAESEA